MTIERDEAINAQPDSEVRRVLREIELMVCLTSPFCIIPAAGLGTRMGELCKDTPKCLLEVNGKPLVRHVVDYWRERANQIIVVLPPGTRIPLPPKVMCVEQSSPVGPVDAVLLALGEVRCPRNFMVALGDCLCDGAFDFDFGTAGLPVYSYNGLAVKRDPTGELGRSYSVQVEGLVAPDFTSPYVTAVTEKPGLGMGFYWFGWEALLHLEACREKSITEVYARMIEHGVPVRPVWFEGRYLNVTYPEDLTRWPG